MNVKIGAEAALFPEKEYISGIAVAVWESQVVKIVIPYCTYILIQGMTDF